MDSSLAHPPPLDSDSIVSIPDQSLVKESVGLVSPPVVHSVPKEHNYHIAHVLLISSDSPESKNDPPILTDQEIPYSIPTEHRANHMIPPSSSSVVSFDWSHLTTFCLRSYVPFQITVHAYNIAVHGTLLDQGASISLMPSTTWKALGSP